MHVTVAVIGRGMIGSAAARHLAESGISTALIGPLEPEDRKTSPGPFSSHPDEGRITRIFGRTPVWAALAAASLARYSDIAARSGINFYTASGCAAVFPDASTWIAAAEGYELEASMVSADWLRERTGIAAPPGNEIAFESAPAGHINPRRLVAAQAVLAEMAGASVIEHAGETVSRSNSCFEVAGVWGSLTADRVLIATGAFGAELMDRELDLERRARTTLMAEMEPRAELPTLISAAPDERLHEIYWCPPVPYPFGKTCLKAGGNMVDTRVLESGDLVEWFHSDGDPEEIDALEVSVRSLLPDVDIATITTAPCVITGTPTGHPYIGFVDDGLAVAIAGNGSAAKSSDELGRLGAALVTDGDWTEGLDASIFTPQFA